MRHRQPPFATVRPDAAWTVLLVTVNLAMAGSLAAVISTLVR